MKYYWEWLSKPTNQKTLKLLGGIVGAIITGLWAFFTYVYNPDPPQSSPSTSTQISVSELQGGFVAGRDQYINITSTEGIPEEKFKSLAGEWSHQGSPP